MPRPLGSKNKDYSIMIPAWKPITWKPVYETMVALSVAGQSNVQIAETLDYTPQQIGNILRSKEAIAVKQKFISTVRQNTEVDIPTRLLQLRDKAIENIAYLIEDKSGEYREAAPFKHAEMSQSFLKGIGVLNDGSSKINVNNNTTNQTLNISDAKADELMKVLAESNEIRRLNSGNPK